jgi:hypothetical protein
MFARVTKNETPFVAYKGILKSEDEEDYISLSWEWPESKK